MTDREPSPGELAEDIAKLDRKLDILVDRIDAKFDRLDSNITKNYPRSDLYAANRAADLSRVESADRRVAAVEERLTWVGRAAVTGLLLPVLVAIIVGVILVGNLR